MLGYTLSGDDFARSPVAKQAGIRQIRTRERWDEARRIVDDRQAAADAAETDRRRQVEEFGERMGWDLPVWGDEPGQAPIDRLPRAAVAPVQLEDSIAVPISPESPAEPRRDPDRLSDGVEGHGHADPFDDAPEPPWHGDEEDVQDRAVLARITQVREAAARRSEADQEFSAYAIAGLDRTRDPDPAPRLARGSRARLIDQAHSP